MTKFYCQRSFSCHLLVLWQLHFVNRDIWFCQSLINTQFCSWNHSHKISRNTKLGHLNKQNRLQHYKFLGKISFLVHKCQIQGLHHDPNMASKQCNFTKRSSVQKTRKVLKWSTAWAKATSLSNVFQSKPYSLIFISPVIIHDHPKTAIQWTNLQ